MTIYRNHGGGWVVGEVRNGHYYEQAYYFYTKRESVRLFRLSRP